METNFVPQRDKIKEIEKLRIKNDSNFIPFKVVTIFLFVATTLVLLYYLFLFNANNLSEFKRTDAQITFFIIILFGYLFAFLSFIPRFAFLSVRPNVVDEKLYIKDGVMYRTIYGKTPNTSPDVHVDNSEKYVRCETLNLKAISACRYDPVTRRLEITGAYQIDIDGKPFTRKPSAINRAIIYYDYYEPSLVNALQEAEVVVKEERIKYRLVQK